MAWRKWSGDLRVWSPYEEHFCLPRVLQIDLMFSLKPGISNYPVSKYVSHLRQGLSLCMAPDMMGHLFLMQVSVRAFCVHFLFAVKMYVLYYTALEAVLTIPTVVYGCLNDSCLLGFRQPNCLVFLLSKMQKLLVLDCSILSFRKQMSLPLQPFAGYQILHLTTRRGV